MTSIEHLPDPILGRTLVLAGAESRSSVCLVCKRWRVLLHDEPDAWRSLVIAGDRLASLDTAPERQAWLARSRILLAEHGTSVTALTVRGGTAAAASGTSLAELLAPLPSGGQLAHLSLEHRPLLPPAALEGLKRFSSLASLDLDVAQVPADAAAALAALTQLSSVALRAGKLSPPLMAALAGLPQLRRLVAEAPRLAPPFGPWLAGFGGRLASLRIRAALLPGSLGDDLLALSQLTALEADSAESPLPPLQQLAALPLLRTLRLHDRGGCNHGAVACFPVPAGFASLRRFCYSRGSGWIQVATAQLRGCSFDPADAHGSGPSVLTLSGLRPTGALAPLLQALLPPGEPCRCLSICGGQLAAAALEGCSAALHPLVGLRQEGCAAGGSGGSTDSGGAWEAVFSLLLRQAPGLSRLAFSPAGGLAASGVPAALAAHCGQLRRLELAGLALPTGLPVGPFLAGLRSLILTGCSCAGPGVLLPTMAHATALTHLALEGAGNWGPEHRSAVLCMVPNLSWLQIAEVSSSGQQAAQQVGRTGT
ncbi:hypothetical protein ABPG75_007904 [Micractinium tetrahymenae]